MKTCPRCHSTIEDTCRFCPNCGASQILISPEPPGSESQAPEAALGGELAPPPLTPPPVLPVSALLRPALISGLAMGALSALPIVNLGCCLWMLGGGALASYLYLAQTPPGFVATSTEGAKVGLVAGFFGFVTQTVLFAIFQGVMSLMGRGPFSTRFRDELQEMLARQGEIPPETRQLLDWISTPAGTAFFVVLTITVFFAAFILLGALGGVFGATWLSKKASPGPG